MADLALFHPFYHNLKQVLSLAGAVAPDSFKLDL